MSQLACLAEGDRETQKTEVEPVKNQHCIAALFVRAPFWSRSLSRLYVFCGQPPMGANLRLTCTIVILALFFVQEWACSSISPFIVVCQGHGWLCVQRVTFQVCWTVDGWWCFPSTFQWWIQVLQNYRKIPTVSQKHGWPLIGDAQLHASDGKLWSDKRSWPLTCALLVEAVGSRCINSEASSSFSFFERFLSVCSTRAW